MKITIPPRYFLAFAAGLGILLIIGGVENAAARLGETKEQIVARYGEPTKEPDPIVTASEGAAVYVKDNVEVTVEFKRGKAWLVSYRASSVHMKTDFEEELRDANDGVEAVGDWKDPFQHLGRNYWVTSDKAIYGVLYETGVQKVYRFVTSECLEEMRTERKEKVKEAQPGLDTAPAKTAEDETEEEEGEKVEKGSGF
jgi:hypothetical protein